jgi:hypothetical protein
VMMVVSIPHGGRGKEEGETYISTRV